jgi:hypothetical protein
LSKERAKRAPRAVGCLADTRDIEAFVNDPAWQAMHAPTTTTFRWNGGGDFLLGTTIMFPLDVLPGYIWRIS